MADDHPKMLPWSITGRLEKPRILGYGFSERPDRIEVNYKFIHISIYSCFPQKNFTGWWAQLDWNWNPG